ncbi:MAG TPA: c-type cytochrome [Opitutaceae bacterium]|nr:c-type cytochrome [Opitutaceae bacterium]HRJ46928.1 c-type cytochrome [Opitutaceae bacterium]
MKLPLAVLLLAASLPANTPDPGLAARGELHYSACAACHDPGGTTALGPDLRGVFGRRAATAPGFRYSGALRRSGIVWDQATLDRFIADPQTAVPGNTMPYPGLPDSDQRRELLAYLKTLQ